MKRCLRASAGARAVHCLKWPALGPRINKTAAGAQTGLIESLRRISYQNFERRRIWRPWRGGRREIKGGPNAVTTNYTPDSA